MRCESCGCVDHVGNKRCYGIARRDDYMDVDGFDPVLCDHCFHEGDSDQVFRNVNRKRREVARQQARKKGK